MRDQGASDPVEDVVDLRETKLHKAKTVSCVQVFRDRHDSLSTGSPLGANPLAQYPAGSKLGPEARLFVVPTR